jgi:flagellar assembly factor FliW
MHVETSRFGPLEVDDSRIFTFHEGLLGFPHQRRYTLVHTCPDPVFYWLQAVDEPGLAFLVCDPRTFVPDYEVPVRPDDLELLDLRDLADCQVLVIVNKVSGCLTGNLLGPLVVGTPSLRAKQMVLTDRRYGTRQVLVPLEAARPLAKTA